ncbi:MAG TPA: hypothetical protein VJ650_03465 [Gemmatimonadaceae bacterium]|nr:hypothetical protein [Gemmatimonadaceae bacterium]
MADGRDLPARLDRAALERVLARAAELQASELDPGEYISEERLLDIAKEVGLAPHHMRQALAEERTRVAVPDETGPVARFAGVARVIATRVIGGTPAEVLASLDTWMQREECLTIKRRFPERIVWEEHRGFWTQLRRGMDMGGRRYVLARAHEVAATAVPVDDQRSLVRLEADLANVRTGRLAGAGASTAVGVAAGGTLLALGFFPIAAIAPVIVGAVAGYGVARSHRGVASRAQLALEQVLDRLESRQPVQPRPIGTAIEALVDRATRGLLR